MRIHEGAQGTDAWHELRRGRITASEVKKLVTPTGAPSASRFKALGEVIQQRLNLDTDIVAYAAEHGFYNPFEIPDNLWMHRGRTLEAEALNWLRLDVNEPEVDRPMFIEVDEYVGFSPDACFLHADDIIPIELKCPAPSTHIAWLMEDVLPKEHAVQVHAQMAMSEAPYAYFMSYCPGVEPLVIRVDRSDITNKIAAAIDAARETLKKFDEDYDHE